MSFKFLRSYVRKVVAGYLRDTCTLQQETHTRGDYGQTEIGWQNIVSDLPCRLIEAGQNTTEKADDFAGQEAIDEIKRLIVPYDTALDAGQRVLLGGETWYIAALETQMTDESYRAAIVVKRSGADG